MNEQELKALNIELLCDAMVNVLGVDKMKIVLDHYFKLKLMRKLEALKTEQAFNESGYELARR